MLFANESRAGRTLVLFLLAPALIGIVTGSSVSAASTVVERWALGQLAALPDLLPIVGAPLALVVTLGVVVYVTRVATPSTAELYILTYHDPNGRIPLRQLPGRVLAAATTVGFGGAQGLESPSALMGAGFGDVLGRRCAKLAPYEARSLMVAGASAGIAAVFSSPALGTFYGMEVPFRRDVDARRFVPCAVAAAVSYITRWWLIGPRHLVVMSGSPTIDLSFVAGVALVALACGIGARLFASVDEWLHARAQHHTRLGRALAAGLVLAAITWAGHALSHEWVTFGPGYIAADWLFSGSHPRWAIAGVLFVRAAATLTCVYGGGGGGVFTALACCGAFVGQLVAEVVGQAETFVFPLLGAASFLGAGYRLPVGCAMLVAEISGELAVATAGLVAVSLSQIFMGEASVSDAKADSRAMHRTSPPSALSN